MKWRGEIFDDFNAITIKCKYLLHIRAGLVVVLVEHSRAQNRVEETLDRRNIVDLDLKQFEMSIKNLGFKKMWKEHTKKNNSAK